MDSNVTSDDVNLIDDYLAPGYGIPGPAALRAIVLGAQTEGLMLDPVYTCKALAAAIDRASLADRDATFLFVHTGGSPALFGYNDTIEQALASTESVDSPPQL